MVSAFSFSPNLPSMFTGSNGKCSWNQATFSSFSFLSMVQVLYTSIPPGFTYCQTTDRISLCNSARESRSSGFTLFLISGFFPRIPRPEQGRSATTRSMVSTSSSSSSRASQTSAEILENPERSILSSIIWTL